SAVVAVGYGGVDLVGQRIDDDQAQALRWVSGSVLANADPVVADRQVDLRAAGGEANLDPSCAPVGKGVLERVGNHLVDDQRKRHCPVEIQRAFGRRYLDLYVSGRRAVEPGKVVAQVPQVAREIDLRGSVLVIERLV